MADSTSITTKFAAKGEIGGSLPALQEVSLPDSPVIAMATLGGKLA